MRFPRLTVRRLMLLIALVAITYAAAKRLIVGDGGVDFEVVNGMGRPIRDVRLSCNGREVIATELAHDGSMRNRLWPADYRRGGAMDGRFGLSYTVDGTPHRWDPSFTFDLLRYEPSVRLVIAERNGEEAWGFTFPGEKVSDRKRHMRQWWFRMFPPDR